MNFLKSFIKEVDDPNGTFCIGEMNEILLNVVIRDLSVFYKVKIKLYHRGSNLLYQSILKE